MDAAKSPEALPFGNLGQLPVEKVPVSSLVIAGSPRRSGEDIAHIRALAELHDRLPPILVHRPTMRVLDGIHRLRAARLHGVREIEVRFFEGDEASSFVLAVQANIAHGLPLSLADRKAAAARIVQSYPQWSDRAVAAVTGLAHKTVAVIRGRPTGEDDQLDARIGRDGRLRPRNSAERREIASKLIADNPDASLREIARKAFISPETARNVRASLARGSSAASSEHHGLRHGTSMAPGSAVRDRAPSQRTGHVGRADSGRASAWQTLRGDPAFRSTNSGRFLLRMLSSCKVIQEHTQQLIDCIPQHCMSRVAMAAQECASAWQEFADRLEQQDREIS